jgi:uncharacterized protein
LNPKLEVKASPIEGRGLFALVPFEEGARIPVGSPNQQTTIMSDAQFQEYMKMVDSYDAVYLGNGTHRVSLVSREDNPSNYGNQSCDPNTALVGQDRVALRRIEPGEELTIDYSLHSPASWSMECHCGAPSCRGIVRGGVE